MRVRIRAFATSGEALVETGKWPACDNTELPHSRYGRLPPNGYERKTEPEKLAAQSRKHGGLFLAADRSKMWAPSLARLIGGRIEVDTPARAPTWPLINQPPTRHTLTVKE